MKQKLLLLHGALGSEKQLQPVKSLLEADYEVYSMNFEGHGSNLSEREYGMDLFAQNVIDFLNKASIEQVNLFGYSMGGYVSLNTARLNPHRIGKIVTLGTKFDWSLASAEKEVKMLNPDIIEQKVPHFAQKLKEEQAPQDWKEVMYRTARMMLAMGNGKKLTDEHIKSVEHQVTIGVGDADKMVTLEESRQVVELLSNGSLQVLQGVEHPIDNVDPQVVADYILQHI